MINRVYLPQAKLRKTINLLKGFGSLFNGHLMTIAKSVLILVKLLFHQKEAKQVKFTKSFKELSNWYGGNLTKQGDMVIKIATHTFIGKSLDKIFQWVFRVEFIMSPMGMAVKGPMKNNRCAI